MLGDLNQEIEEKNQEVLSIRSLLDENEQTRNRLSGEVELLMEKMTAMKNAFAPKLQKELVCSYYPLYISCFISNLIYYFFENLQEESNRLRSEVESQNQIISNLQEERHLLQSQLEELVKEKSTLEQDQSKLEETSRLETNLSSAHAEIEQLKFELDKTSKKLQALQQHLAESEESATQEALNAEATLDEYKAQLMALESERENWDMYVKLYWCFH
jgi:chromosome segregation ATPase